MDNVAVTPGTGATIATDDVGGVQYQRVKMDIGGDGVSSPVTSSNPLPIEAATVGALSFYPAFVAPPTGENRSNTYDEFGALFTRGGVTTDEGSFRLNFSGSSTSRSLGTCTFTNGSRAVTGTGFSTANPAFQVGDYVRLTADGNSAYSRVYSIDSDTALTLDSTYSGAGGTGASDVAPYKPTLGTGGSIAVGSGLHTLTCGTTAAVTHYVIREVDYGPLVWQSTFNLSQRIANQDIYRGLFDAPSATMRTYARFHFTGTTNTTVICETGWAETAPASGSDQQATTVTIPNGGTSAQSLVYRIELRSEVVSFYIDGRLVATHRSIAPRPYEVLTCGTVCANGTTPGSSTTVNVTTELCNNLDSLRISIANDTDSVLASPPQMVQTINYNVAGIIAINTDLGFIDTQQCGAVIVQCISMGTTGVVTPAFTADDGTTYSGAQLIPIGGGAVATTFNAAGYWVIPAVGPRLRLRLTTATTAGTTTIRAWCTALAPTITPTSLTVTASNLSCNVAQMNGVAVTMGNGTSGTGVQRVAIASDNTANSNPWLDTLVPSAAQGASTTHHLISAASTNATSVKASAGTVNTLQCSNSNAAARYLKLYNKASAPTVGTDTPVMTILVPPTQTIFVDTGAYGIRFSTGIAYALTTGIAVADTGAVGTDMSVSMFYT